MSNTNDLNLTRDEPILPNLNLDTKDSDADLLNDTNEWINNTNQDENEAQDSDVDDSFDNNSD